MQKKTAFVSSDENNKLRKIHARNQIPLTEINNTFGGFTSSRLDITIDRISELDVYININSPKYKITSK
jgi:hypothetical protein